MKVPSAVLLAVLAVVNAAPTAPEPDTPVEVPDDVEAKGYDCVVTLYDDFNWNGRSKQFHYWFSKKQAPVCKTVGDDFNDIASSIHVAGDKNCECKLHVDTCSQGGDYEVPKIWPPGIWDLRKNNINNRATSITCKIV